MNQFFIYEYWNPIKNEPFYIGKGQGRRHLDHLNEAKNIKNGNCVNWHKINTI